ncbi:MAG: hypothetical protein HOO96_08320 [Polyangiaceae bacterium]|nr:hypothetical protein [Polyangiaceae bacterium]
MRSPTLGALAACALFALACTKTEHVTAEPPRPDPDPESVYPTPTPLPAPLAPLGAPCDAPVPDRTAAQCGLSGKVSIVSTNLPAWPAGLQAIAPPPASNEPNHFEQYPVTRVGLQRGRVWVASSCAICRTQVDEVQVVDIALATDAQLAQLQARLGIAKTPILRSTRAFADRLPRQGT